MRRGSSRGAVAVEMALILPLLILFLVGAAQVGLVVVGNSVGSNAAREGARVASIKFDCADEHAGCANPSTSYTAIYNAVMKRLAGLVKTSTVTVSVKCLDGSSSTFPAKTCDANIVPDTDAVEVTIGWHHIGETPFVADNGHTEKARAVIAGTPDLTSVGPATDTTAPQLVALSLQALDGNHDGIINTVQMTFDEDIVQGNLDTNAFTVANSASGAAGNGHPTAASASGRVVTLTIGGTSVNTAPGSMTVALATSATGVVDLAGNRASFAATQLVDKAQPVLLTASSTHGATTGKVEGGEVLTLTFSEPVVAAATTLTEADASPKDTVSIGGITSGALSTNSNAYVPNNKTVTATAAASASGSQVLVTIGVPTCSPVVCTAGTGNDGSTWEFVPSSSILDSALNAAARNPTSPAMISNIF